MELLLKNAIIVTVNKEREIIYGGSMVVDGGKIVDIGETEYIRNKYSSFKKEVDCEGKAIFPGFVNTHNHLFQTLLKGLGDDMVLSDWLATMTFPAAQFLEAEDCYYGAMLGCVEGIKSGMTTQVDYMYPHAREGLSDGVIKAYKDLKIRGIFGRGCMDSAENFGVCPAIMQKPKEVERDLVRVFDKYHNTENERIKIWTAPAALWSNSEEMLRMLWEVTNSYKSGMTIHVSETPFDRMATSHLHGCEGTDCLDKYGILGDNVLMVHCVCLTEKDIRRAKHYDLKVSYNPVSNMYLSSGVAPIPQLINAGVTCGLGVDGAASNNGQDMLELMKTASLLQKVHTLDPTVITAEKILEMATIDGARAVGLDNEIGSLEIGKKADFVIFNPYLNPKAVPMHNPVSTLVYSSSMQNIESVAIDGEFVMENGKLTNVESEIRLYQKVQMVSEDLCKRGNITNRMDGHKWRSIAF